MLKTSKLDFMIHLRPRLFSVPNEFSNVLLVPAWMQGESERENNRQSGRQRVREQAVQARPAL